MWLFLEGYLRKKLQVAERLHVYGDEFPRDVVTKKLNISNSTLSQYLAEITELYNEYYESGDRYNSYSLTKVAEEIISRSKKIEALRLLFLYPGNAAYFYKKKLNTSDASFARLIANLKEDLERFHVTIIVRNGYRLKAEDEFQFSFLFSYIGLFYFWSRHELEELLYSFGKEREIKEIMNYDFSSYTYANDPFEVYFFQTVCLTNCLYHCYDQKLDENGHRYRPLSELFEQFTRVMCQVSEQVKERIGIVLEACFPEEQLSNTTREAIIKLATCVGFQIKFFPYNVNTLPLRMKFFDLKYRIAYPERTDSINNFIYRASKFVRVDLMKRYEMVFYFVADDDLLGFQRKKTVHLFVYSSVGIRRTNYIYRQMIPLLGYFNEDSTLKIFNDENKCKLPVNAYIATTDLLDDIPKEKQFLISDFVSSVDYLSFLTWLRKK